MTKPTIWILVGLPGAGKTSWREDHVAKHPRPIKVVSSDDFIEAAARGAGVTYRDVFRLLNWKAMRSRLLRETFRHATLGYDIIVDRMNHTKLSRRGFLEAAEMLEHPTRYHRVAVICDLPEEIVRRTNQQRLAQGRICMPGAIEDTLQQYERPTKAEGFHEIIVHAPAGPGLLSRAH